VEDQVHVDMTWYFQMIAMLRLKPVTELINWESAVNVAVRSQRLRLHAHDVHRIT
jgi:hypothetical protein